MTAVDEVTICDDENKVPVPVPSMFLNEAGLALKIKSRVIMLYKPFPVTT